MIIDNETKRKLRDMGCAELLEALEAQDDMAFMSASFEDRIKVAVDNAHSMFVDGKIKRLINRARLRYDYADIRTVDLAEERKLDRFALMQLATCTFVRTGGNVVLEGFTGSGKSFFGCALVKEACRNRMRGYYVRIPDLHSTWCVPSSIFEQKLHLFSLNSFVNMLTGTGTSTSPVERVAIPQAA